MWTNVHLASMFAPIRQVEVYVRILKAATCVAAKGMDTPVTELRTAKP